MTNKTKTKRISLLEFRAWLEGVEELQSADWHPSLTQWKLIRAKIDSIGAKEGTVEQPAATAKGKQVQQSVAPARHYRPANVPAPVAPIDPTANPIYSGAFVIPDVGGGVPDIPFDGQIHHSAPKR